MCAQQVTNYIDTEKANSVFRAQFIVDSRAVQYRHGTGAGITKPNCLKIGHFAGTECLQPIEQEVF